MNSYNKYTDLQINELVATRLKKKCLLTEESVLAYMDSGYRTFDPCNNPTDAMPIIIENKISLLAGDGNFWCARYGEWNILPCPSGIEFIEKAQVINDSPYRAAMELFLMMKDAENEKIRPYLL
ncbi:hypothetical protein KMU_13730 [Proteus vulgaris]|uniref:phage protein NinX family protein n=1 Tax=Proteus vulgaris TaxID=585 RepID=UPI00003DCE99|nr:phage protein NinX family protein [Proteus vulgaris]GLX63332.1 hypothetical protein KMU_13730 [Proteus vulgaris]HCZ8848165.1 DUF2591 family protein [Proteus mirabilis]